MPIVLRCSHCSTQVRLGNSAFAPESGGIATCPTCGERLPGPPAVNSTTSPVVGGRFAHYQIEEKLREGPLTTVYRARNIPLGRAVIIKMLSDEVANKSPDVADRLVSAARSWASVDHRNILSVYFVGKYNGRFFIETQYADAGSVRDGLNQKGHFHPHDAARIIRDAARGLAAADQRGILHHDVRPENLMRMSDGTVKVADFGWSALECKGASPTDGQLPIRVLRYMAPERLAGEAADHRSDIYSLGATFFHLLTGHPPFDAPSHDSLLQMLAEEPVPSPRKHVPDIPQALCDVVLKMAAKKPAHRCASYESLIKNLDDFLGEKPRPPVAVPVLNAGLPRARAATEAPSPQPILSDLALETPAPALGRPAPISAQAMERESARLLRQARARRYTTYLVRFGRLLLLLAVLFACIQGVRWAIGGAHTALQARQDEHEAQERAHAAAQLAQTGRKLESLGDWAAAAKNYEESLSVNDDNSVRERFDIVREAMRGSELEERNHWAEAEKILTEALPNLLSKGDIPRRLRRIESGKAYDLTYARGKTAYEKEDWHGAAEQFTRAAELAAQVKTLSSDAAALAADAQKRASTIDERQARMRRLLDLCKSKKNVYAFHAACDYYRHSPPHGRFDDELRAREEEAQVARASLVEEGPRSAVTADDLMYIVKPKKGEALHGKIAARNGESLTLDVTVDGKTTRRMFHLNDILSADPIVPEDVNNRRAEQLYGELIEAWKASRPFDALRIIGELQTKFADTRIMANEDHQKANSGQTLTNLLSAAVQACEVMCPECEGIGTLVCPECGGKGEKIVTCKTCENLARLPVCPKCRGSRLRLTSACPDCGGSGTQICRRCSGKGCHVCGMRGKWECKSCGGRGKTFSSTKCPQCHGTGKVGEKTCPKCLGVGKPLCTYCNGTGRQTCPDCNGERKVTIPCSVCAKTGRILCPKCKGNPP